MKQKLLNFTSVCQPQKADIFNILILVSTWIAMAILVNPIGDFPLNDDWAYGRSVQSLIEKGDFQISDWTATNLFSQVFWGALFCLPFGFSFTALRFSTLTLGLVGVLATYGLLREVNSTHKVSMLGALLVAINPIYFELSNTFMNDVHFFGFATLSLYFLLRGLKKDSSIEVLVGVAIACVAILARQVGLAIFLAFGFAYVIKKGISIATIIKGFSPTLIGVFIQIFYQKWLQLTGRLPYSYGDQINTLFKELSKGFGQVLFNQAQLTSFCLVYLGLFLFPFLIYLFYNTIKKTSALKQILIISVSSFLFVVTMQVLISPNRLMPFMGNVLVDFGLGPVGLINTYLPQAPRIFWWLVTAIGVVGAALLIQFLCLAIWQVFARHQNSELNEKKWFNALIISFLSIYFLPLSLIGLNWQGFYDRYLIILLPLVMMLVSVSTPRMINRYENRFISMVLVVMMLGGSGFTIAATHDYLSSNRSLWQALNNLVQESQISPRQINGGFEFNGWYLCNQKKRISSDKAVNFACLWGNDNEDYVMSFLPVNGYKEVKRYPFKTWLPLTKNNVLVLQKIR